MSGRQKTMNEERRTGMKETNDLSIIGIHYSQIRHVQLFGSVVGINKIYKQ